MEMHECVNLKTQVVIQLNFYITPTVQSNMRRIELNSFERHFAVNCEKFALITIGEYSQKEIICTFGKELLHDIVNKYGL